LQSGLLAPFLLHAAAAAAAAAAAVVGKSSSSSWPPMKEKFLESSAVKVGGGEGRGKKCKKGTVLRTIIETINTSFQACIFCYYSFNYQMQIILQYMWILPWAKEVTAPSLTKALTSCRNERERERQRERERERKR
jgi:hypothetical protein